MICEPFQLPDGTRGIMCHRARRPKCSFCSERASLECDFPVPGGKTCDKPICGSCAVKIGPNIDHCPDHKGKPVQIGLDL